MMKFKGFTKQHFTQRQGYFPIRSRGFRFIALLSCWVVIAPVLAASESANETEQSVQHPTSQDSANKSIAHSARKQIHAAITAYINIAIKQEAKSRNWPDYQTKMNLFMAEEVDRNAPCSHPLHVSSSAGKRFDVGNIRFKVVCEDSLGWESAVTVKTAVYLPLVFAKQSLVRGHVLTAADLTIKKYDISHNRGGYTTDLNEIIGLTVKRQLRESQPITLAQLEMPIIIERGQQVMMIANQNGIEASTLGTALKKGRKGELIKVKNSNSGREVSAIVDSPGVVRTVQITDK